MKYCSHNDDKWMGISCCMTISGFVCNNSWIENGEASSLSSTPKDLFSEVARDRGKVESDELEAVKSP